MLSELSVVAARMFSRSRTPVYRHTPRNSPNACAQAMRTSTTIPTVPRNSWNSWGGIAPSKRSPKAMAFAAANSTACTAALMITRRRPRAASMPSSDFAGYSR